LLRPDFASPVNGRGIKTISVGSVDRLGVTEIAVMRPEILPYFVIDSWLCESKQTNRALLSLIDEQAFSELPAKAAADNIARKTVIQSSSKISKALKHLFSDKSTARADHWVG
jgi:hypothetical protein